MGIAALTNWSTNQILTSTGLKADFATIRDHYNANAVETSGNQTIAGVKTFSDIPVFSTGATITAGGLTVTAGGATITAGGLTVSASGAAITGNSTVTGTLGVSALLTASLGITVSASGIAVTGESTFDDEVTFATAPVFSAGFTIAAGGIAVTGDSTVTGAFTNTGSAILGAAGTLSAGATTGFVYIPTTGNAPGTPVTAGVRSAMYYDPSTNRLHVYDNLDAAWKSVVLS